MTYQELNDAVYAEYEKITEESDGNIDIMEFDLYLDHGDQTASTEIEFFVDHETERIVIRPKDRL